MNRQEFMKQLEYLLRDIPVSEREDALAYYNDYFDEAGVENEYHVIQELGSPEVVAQTILADVQKDTSCGGRQDYCSPEMEQEETVEQEQSFYEQQKRYEQMNTQSVANEKKTMSTSTKILIIVLLIFTFPLWIGIVAGLFGGLVGLIGGLFGIIVGLIGAAFGLIVGGIVCIGGGILCILAEPIEGLACIGVGAILAAIGVLLALLGILIVGLWLPKLIKAFISWIRSLFHRNEGGNEI